MQKRTLLRTYLYKACPRCGGDLVLDAEEEPRLVPPRRLDYVCLQCGRRATLKLTAAREKELARTVA